jgi:hypothetical protein
MNALTTHLKSLSSDECIDRSDIAQSYGLIEDAIQCYQDERLSEAREVIHRALNGIHTLTEWEPLIDALIDERVDQSELMYDALFRGYELCRAPRDLLKVTRLTAPRFPELCRRPCAVALDRALELTQHLTLASDHASRLQGRDSASHRRETPVRALDCTHLAQAEFERLKALNQTSDLSKILPLLTRAEQVAYSSGERLAIAEAYLMIGARSSAERLIDQLLKTTPPLSLYSEAILILFRLDSERAHRHLQDHFVEHINGEHPSLVYLNFARLFEHVGDRSNADISYTLSALVARTYEEMKEVANASIPQSLMTHLLARVKDELDHIDQRAFWFERLISYGLEEAALGLFSIDFSEGSPTVIATLSRARPFVQSPLGISLTSSAMDQLRELDISNLPGVEIIELIELCLEFGRFKVAHALSSSLKESPLDFNEAVQMSCLIYEESTLGGPEVALFDLEELRLRAQSWGELDHLATEIHHRLGAIQQSRAVRKGLSLLRLCS